METPVLHILVLFDKNKAQPYSCRVRKSLHYISYLLMCLSGRNFNNFNSPPPPGNFGHSATFCGREVRNFTVRPSWGGELLEIIH